MSCRGVEWQPVCGGAHWLVLCGVAACVRQCALKTGLFARDCSPSQPGCCLRPHPLPAGEESGSESEGEEESGSEQPGPAGEGPLAGFAAGWGGGFGRPLLPLAAALVRGLATQERICSPAAALAPLCTCATASLLNLPWLSLNWLCLDWLLLKPLCLKSAPAAGEAGEAGSSEEEDEEASGGEGAPPAGWGSGSDGEGGGWGSDGGAPLGGTRRLEDLSEDDFSGASDGEDEDKLLQLGALLRWGFGGGEAGVDQAGLMMGGFRTWGASSCDLQAGCSSLRTAMSCCLAEHTEAPPFPLQGPPNTPAALPPPYPPPTRAATGRTRPKKSG